MEGSKKAAFESLLTLAMCGVAALILYRLTVWYMDLDERTSALEAAWGRKEAPATVDKKEE